MIGRKNIVNEKELKEVLQKIQDASIQFDDVCAKLQDKLQEMELQQKLLLLLEDKVKANSILITKLYTQNQDTEKKEKIEGYS